MPRTVEAKRWTEQVARRELQAWKRSGEPLSRFAAGRGYQAQRLSWWRQRLQGEPARAAATAVALAPAVVTGGVAGCAVAVGLGRDGTVRVEVSDAEAVHPQWLGQLVSALRRGA